MDGLYRVLAGNRYPGRGVLWVRTRDGALRGGYFLTGRSAASRARVLRRGDGELIVAPTGESAHDPLRHYVAAREHGGWLVFGNGEQVTVVADRLAEGRTPTEALAGLEYEPDPPIFTPRITVAADLAPERGAWFGAARRSRGGRTAARTGAMTLRRAGCARYAMPPTCPPGMKILSAFHQHPVRLSPSPPARHPPAPPTTKWAADPAEPAKPQDQSRSPRYTGAFPCPAPSAVSSTASPSSGRGVAGTDA